ncbi:hypothetical protein MJG53_005700 [Ovis ammon polii x Ovis aries]|uniref:Uncharacterized protein n=1 Tax=Ovis ammon polii x Ovis aries TaxID=2918886 RepID=A0ACB9V6B9_9CETA|nr:hypothetical protein MJG53_005700 [Ovis ammon polii x Ovis aries]
MLLRNQRIQSDPGSERELRAVEIRRHSRANAFNVFLFSEGNITFYAEFLVTLSPFNSEYQLLKFSDDGALFSCGMQWIPSHSEVVLRLGTVILRSYGSLYLVPASLEPGTMLDRCSGPSRYLAPFLYTEEIREEDGSDITKASQQTDNKSEHSPQAPPHLLISSLTVSWVEMGYDRVGNAQVLCLFVTVENLLPLFSWSTVLFRELVLSPLDCYNSQYIDVSTSSLLLLWFMQQ